MRFEGGAGSTLEILGNFAELKQHIDNAGGSLSVQMYDLRDRVQAGRLDDGPIDQIENNLVEFELAATRLTRQQHDWTIVYAPNSDIGRVICAAVGDQESSDQTLRAAIQNLAASDTAVRSSKREELDTLRATVNQIKALVATV